MTAADKKPPLIKNLVAFLVAVALTIAISLIYLGQEKALYWSDFNYYHIITIAAARKFLEDPVTFPLLVLGSTALNYNLIYTVPLLPGLLLISESREAFITSMALFYQLPYVMLLGALASYLFKGKESKASPQIIFWLQVFLALSLATLWAPTLRGYPDFAAASLILLASLLYLKKGGLTSAKTIIGVGICLALAPLIRRHFFYLAFAQALAMLIHQLYIVGTSTGGFKWGRFFKHSFLPWLATGMVSAIVLCSLGFLFVSSIIGNPYFSLYSSAYVSALEGLHYLVSAYGLVVFSMACTGFIMAFKTGIVHKDRAVFLYSFAVLSFIIWPVFGKHLAIHYTIYSDPFICLGTTCLFIWLTKLERIRLRSYILAILVVFWSYNFVIGLSNPKETYIKQTRYGMLTTPLQEPNPAGRLVSANYGPIIRKDFSQLSLLLDTVRDLSRDGKKVFIASDNSVLGADILRNLERKKTGTFEVDHLKLVEPPMLDSRDALAIEGLLTADYVVLARPFLPMYRPEDSRDLLCVLECFENDWQFAKDFEKLPGQFKLDESSTITIWKRLKPTLPAVAATTFEKMKKFVKTDLTGQPSWISTDERYVAHDRQNLALFRVRLSKEQNENAPHYLMSSDTINGAFKLTGGIDRYETDINPKKIRIEVLAVDADGQVRKLKDPQRLQEDYSEFVLEDRTDSPSHLVLIFSTENSKESMIRIRNPVIK
ncbi:hypothetical protein GC174_01740 [bacterium]|nr:hypothetical protein [bacterium]